MLKLPREQTIAIAALGLLLIVCAGLLAVTLQMRADAVTELAQRQDMLARLSARLRSSDDANHKVKLAAAPPRAFIEAAAPGLASADLQAYVAKLAERHAALVSFGAQASVDDKATDAIRIEASMDISLRALQVLLYQLESGTPYVFVDNMTVRSAAATTAGGSGDLPLRVTLGLRAPWHRGPT